MENINHPGHQSYPIDGVKNIIAVSSGKGGVGKSTITTQLATALQQKGLSIGVLDCDIYGPSIPRLFGISNQKPEFNEFRKLEPIRKYGVVTMSMGYLINEDTALIWRGPMLFKAIEQFLRDVMWGELDILLIDLPPGTGDVQLTIAQKVPLSGALVITTPQNLSLIDVQKSIDMFQRLNISILGIIENMSCFQSEDGKIHPLFPKGDLNKYLQKEKIKKLASLPFSIKIAHSSECGIPLSITEPDSHEVKPLSKIASEIIENVCLKTSPQ